MRTYIEYLLRWRVMVLFLTLLLVVTGIVAWISLPIDAFPDVTNIQVMVLTEAPGLSAVDVEQQISYPIELQMGGIPRVLQVRSLSKAGLSQVVVVFDDDVDIYFARQQVFERIQTAREVLPPSADPELGPISTGLGEIYQYTLESSTLSPMELRTIQDYMVSPQLKPIPGVNEVNSFGGFVKQYHVLVRPESLLKYDLTLREVVESIENNNANAAAGFIVKGWEQTYIRGMGLLKGTEDIEHIVLRARDGIPVYVSDIAEVTVGHQPRQGAVTRDGKGESLAGMVIMLRGANSKNVVSAVKGAIPKIQQSLPAGVTINPFYDRTALIQACIKTVTDALLEGGIFVILILFIFLAEFRTSLIVVISLPITYLLTFPVMQWVGLTSNLMSLGGLAFSVGMVVDASIVITENIRRHFSENNDRTLRREITIQSVCEVARPVAFSILIIVVVLFPLLSLQGVEGKMFIPLALTMLIAIFLSLIVALTIIPVVSETVLHQKPEKEFRIITRLHSGYLNFLARVRNRSQRTLIISVIVLIVAGGIATRLGTEFIPNLDEGSIAINIVRLPNASLEGSKAVSTFLEKRIMASMPEVSAVVSKTGRAEISEDPMGPEQTDIFIMLKPRNEWKSGRSKAELVMALQNEISAIPGIRASFSQPIALRVNELISGVKSDLAVKVFGQDIATLKSFADRAAAKLSNIRGAQDVKVEQVSGMEQIEVELNRREMARFGINVSDVNELMEIAVAGKTATTAIDGQMRIATVVRFPAGEQTGIEDLKQLLVRGATGEIVPLARIARITLVEGPAQISREKGIRRVVAEVNIRGRDLGSFVAEAQNTLSELEKELPPGYFMEYGGQFENQQRAMKRLSIVVPIALLLILLFLYLALGSIRDSLLVLLNLPFALVGGIVAIWAYRMPLSVSAAVSFIVLLGIAVQNGVVLIAFFRQLRDEGKSVAETIHIGCKVRFRPLLMTALVSFIGHLPMLYATGSGADIQKPLAVVVMGGLITSTFLTLVILPTVYGWFETRKERRQLNQ